MGGRVRSLKVKINVCGVANKEHAKSLRQYAHTYHHPSMICVASAYWDLPLEHKLGLLYHELGHLLAGPEGSEEDADVAAEEEYGVEIGYKNSDYGNGLQYLKEC